MFYSFGVVEKNHSLEPPVGDEDEILRKAISGGQIVPEIIPGREIEPCPTISAREETVSLSQSDRSSALWTRMLDFPVNGLIFFHRTDCSK
jgi:hypothetical protein